MVKYYVHSKNAGLFLLTQFWVKYEQTQLLKISFRNVTQWQGLSIFDSKLG